MSHTLFVPQHEVSHNFMPASNSLANGIIKALYEDICLIADKLRHLLAEVRQELLDTMSRLELPF